jgi:hypothetical protein
VLLMILLVSICLASGSTKGIMRIMIMVLCRLLLLLMLRWAWWWGQLLHFIELVVLPFLRHICFWQVVSLGRGPSPFATCSGSVSFHFELLIFISHF